MTIKIDTSKLLCIPVPEGCRMIYRHETDQKKIIPGPDGLKAKRVVFATLLGPIPARETLAKGTARCNPKDTDNKKFARIVAHNRAMKQYAKKQASQL